MIRRVVIHKDDLPIDTLKGGFERGEKRSNILSLLICGYHHTQFQERVFSCSLRRQVVDSTNHGDVSPDLGCCQGDRARQLQPENALWRPQSQEQTIFGKLCCNVATGYRRCCDGSNSNPAELCSGVKRGKETSGRTEMKLIECWKHVV